jgi:hypothetical protein
MTGSAVITQTALPGTLAYTSTYNCDGSVLVTAKNQDNSPLLGTILWSPTNETTATILVTTTGIYSAVQTVNGCKSNNAPITVTTLAPPSVFTVGGGGSFCSGPGVSITLSGSETGVQYFLMKGAAIANVINGTGSALSFTGVASPGTYTINAHRNGLAPECLVAMTGSTNVSVNSAPTIVTCFGDQTLNAGANCTAVLNLSSGFVLTLGQPNGSVSYTLTGATTGSGSGTGNGVTYNKGITNVTVTVSNICGSVSCSYKVTVVDVTAPAVNNCPAPIIVNTGIGRTTCNQVVTWSAPTATDNCAVTSITSTHNSGDVFPVGTTTVTYTFKDAAGNASTCSFNVTVVDNTAPVIPVIADATGECSATVTAPVTTDNCAGTVTGTTSDALTYTTQGTHVIHWTFNDGNGNISTANQNVVVLDVTAPVAHCPANISVPVSTTNEFGQGGALVTYTATATDNCSATVSYSIEPGSFFPVGTTTVTVTATDIAGNTNTCTFDVTVNCVNPVVTPINGVSEICADNYDQILTNTTEGGTWSSSNQSVIFVGSNGELYPQGAGTTTISYTVTNEFGCTTTVTKEITVNALPELEPIEGPANHAVCQRSTITLTNSTAGGVWSSSNETIATVNASTGVVTGVGDGLVYIRYTLTNASGCSYYTEWPLRVNALPIPSIVTGPTVVCVGSTINMIAENQNGSRSEEYTMWSNSNPGVASFSDNRGNIEITGLSAGTTILTAFFDKGPCPAVIATIVITVNATPDKPVVTPRGPVTVCPGGSLTLHTPEVADCTYQWKKDGVDIAGATSVDYTATETGSYTVIITNNNGCGSTPSDAVVVTFEDITPPVTPVLPNITAECSATAPVATTTDNCVGTVMGTTNDALTYTTQGDHIIHWTFTDASHNSTTAEQHVIIRDVTAPVAHCPANISVAASTTNGGGQSGALVTYIATASDNCSAAVSYSIAPGSFFPVGTTTVTVTATDIAGNTNTCTFDVTVTCVIATPTITAGGPTTFCPGGSVVLTSSSATGNHWSTGDNTQSITVTASGSYSVTVTDATTNCSATSAATVVTVEDVTAPVTPVLPTITAECSATAPVATTTDNCVGTVIGTTTDALTYHTQGDHVIHWTFTDPSGNSTTAEQHVIIRDVTAPVAHCPANILVAASTTNGSGQSGALVTYAATATDNCSATVGYSIAPGSFFPVGTTTVTVTATDVAGNTNTCTFDVTVKCVIPTPTITAGGPISFCPSGSVVLTSSCTTGNHWSTGAITQSITVNASGSYSVTVTNATTGCSATSAATVVTVQDVTPPTIVCPAPVTVQCASAVPAVNIASVTASDNCSVVVSHVGDVVSNQTAPNKFTITRTYKAMDPSGNSVTCTQIITVNDNTAPTLIVANSLPGDLTGQCLAGVPGAPSTATIAALYTDNCSGTITAVLTNTTTTGSNAAGWTRKYFYSVTDASGNATIACVTYSGRDTQAPVPTVAILPTVAVQCSATVTPPTASDNCAGTITATTNSPLTYNAQGTYTITWTYSDGNGNTSTQTQTVIVKDVTPPAINCPSDITVTANTIVSSISGAYVSYTVNASDNCGVPTITYNQLSGSFFPVGTTTVTATANDGNGNTASCSFKVIVSCVMPSFSTCPASKTVSTDAGACTAVVTYTSAATGTAPVACNYTFSGATTGSGTGNGSGRVFNKGTTTVTITAGNLCGTTICTFTVTVNDTQAPVITCPGNITLACGLATTPANAGTATATDNCGGSVAITYTDAVSGNTTTRTWKATDAAGNISTCTQTITTGGPFVTSISSVKTSNVFTGANIPSTTLFIGYGAQSTTLQTSVPAGTNTYAWSGASVSMLSSTTIANPVFTPTAGGNYLFTVTVTNALGCVSTSSIAICVTDIRVFASANNNCSHQSHSSYNCPHQNHGHSCSHQSHGSSNCPDGNNGSSNNSNNSCGHQSHSSYNCPHQGHGHSCGHQSHSSSNCPDKDDDDDHQTMCNHQAHSSSDCAHKGHNHYCSHRSHSSYSCAHRGTNDRDDDDEKDCDHKSHSSSDCSHRGHNHASCNHQSHSASNCSHNSSSQQTVCNHQSHSSNDCNHSGHNHNTCNHQSHSASNCVHNNNGNNGGCDDDDEDDDKKVYICHVPPGNPGNPLTLSISVNAVAAHLANHSGDRLGSCSQQPCTGYTDTEKPTIDCPDNKTVAYGSSILPVVTGSPEADDNSGDVIITYSDVSTKGTNAAVASFYNYTITRTWKAADLAGNYSACAQLITVTETVKPVITCPGSITVACGSTTPATTGSATATDNASPVTITYTDAVSGNTTTRTWKVTDAAGNYATCTQTITVVDNVKPVITDAADVTVNCGTSTAPSATGTATATDNCSTPTVTYSDVAGTNKITRTWKATDAAGNYVTSTQVITLSAPFTTSISSTPNSSVNTGASSTELFIGYGAQSTTLAVTGSLPSAGAPYTYSWSGNGSGACNSTQASSIVFTPTAAGSYVFTVVTTNKNGCSASQSITICVKDIRERDRYGVLTNSGKVYVCHVPPGNIENAHTICISVNAVPAHVPLHGGDRLGSCDQSCGTDVISRPPVMNCPGDITISCSSVATPANCGTPTAVDNKGKSVTATYTDDIDENVITRTWTATDASGNYTIGVQTITINDATKPVITDVTDKVVNCGASTLPAATGTATATDNCSIPVVTYTDVTSGNVITRTWKATDATGNYSTSIQIITIGSAFTASVSSIPSSSTYTGGVSTNLYLGYGAQTTTLQMCSLPSAGAPYTYAWSGSYTNKLNSTTSAAPLFTPTTFGYYTFSVTVINKFGCTSMATISICVTDIRVAGTSGTGAKVYMCHTPAGSNKTPQTLQVLVSQVPSHLSSSSCGSDGNDRLGTCGQSPCNTTVVNSIVTNTLNATKDGGETVATSEEELKVTAMPNPSTTYFTLKLESKYETPVSMRVMDGSGRVVDARSKIGANSTIQIGHNYSSGTYYAELIQGTQRKVVQLIKGKG